MASQLSQEEIRILVKNILELTRGGALTEELYDFDQMREKTSEID
ncbi:MAG: hypothetical protein ACXADY_20100 [Candidatus Hodarchaeales archaeon]